MRHARQRATLVRPQRKEQRRVQDSVGECPVAAQHTGGGGASVSSSGTSVTHRITTSHRIENQLDLSIVYRPAMIRLLASVGQRAQAYADRWSSGAVVLQQT